MAQFPSRPGSAGDEVAARVDALAEALLATPEYQRLVQARREVEGREAARIMWRDYQELQKEMERRQMAGDPPGEEELQQWQQRLQILSFNPYVRELLEAEMAFAQRVLEAQARLAFKLGMVDTAEGKADGAGSEEAGSRLVKPKPRLWVPGAP